VKFILHSELSTLLQDPQLKANEISSCLAEKGIGFRLHNADLVLIPLRKNSYWYLVVANFRDHRFEVICPFKDIDFVKYDSDVISNFKKVFKAVHPRSTRVHIYSLPTAFGSVPNYNNQLSFFFSNS